MSPPFEEHLRNIDAILNLSNEDRRTHLKMFEEVKLLLVQEMRRVDRVFDKLCIGPSTFGRGRDIAGNLEANEFEILCILEFPFEMEIGLDDDRPGYVHLDLYNVLEKLKDSASNDTSEDIYVRLNEMVDSEYAYLKRNNFQNWISKIIRKALQTMQSGKSDYDIKYEPNQEVAHCLKVCKRSNRQNTSISIDFVPAIAMGRVCWMRKHGLSLIKEDYYHSFYAVPVDTKCKSHKTKLYTFLMINPRAENELLWSKESLKSVFRLLKSLCDSYDIYEMYNYFLKNALLWVLISEEPTFFDNDISEILLYMLNKLLCYFDESLMMHFWVDNCNLLEILKDDDITDYTDALFRATETLNSYPHQPQLSLERTLTHFALPRDECDDDDSKTDTETQTEFKSEYKYEPSFRNEYRIVNHTQNEYKSKYKYETSYRNEYRIVNHSQNQYQHTNHNQYTHQYQYPHQSQNLYQFQYAYQYDPYTYRYQYSYDYYGRY